jgi:hypothetical protein
MQSRARPDAASILSILVGLGVLAAVLVTFLTPNFYSRMHPSVVPGSYGQDALALAALPVFAWGIWAGGRGSLRGRIVWLGLLTFYFYGYALYTIGAMYTPLYPLYLAICATSGWALVLTAMRLDLAELVARRKAFPRVWTAILFLVNVLFLGGAWVAMLLPAIQAVQPPPMYSVFVMDLGFAFPLLTVASIGLLRGKGWGLALAAPLLVKGLTTTTSLVVSEGIAVWMGREADPLPIQAMFALFALGSAVLVGVYFSRFERVQS